MREKDILTDMHSKSVRDRFRYIERERERQTDREREVRGTGRKGLYYFPGIQLSYANLKIRRCFVISSHISPKLHLVSKTHVLFYPTMVARIICLLLQVLSTFFLSSH